LIKTKTRDSKHNIFRLSSQKSPWLHWQRDVKARRGLVKVGPTVAPLQKKIKAASVYSRNWISSAFYDIEKTKRWLRFKSFKKKENVND